MREVGLEMLRPGDLIVIYWSDAWSGENLPRRNAEYDMVWVEWGAFLYYRGKIKKHLVMAYNKQPGNLERWSFTAIPCDLIIKVYLVERGFIQKILPGTLERLHQVAHMTMPKRLPEPPNLPAEVRWEASLRCLGG